MKGEVADVKQKLQTKHACGDYIFFSWEQAPVRQLWRDSKEGEGNIDSLKVPKDSLYLISHEVAVEVRHLYMW